MSEGPTVSKGWLSWLMTGGALFAMLSICGCKLLPFSSEPPAPEVQVLSEAEAAIKAADKSLDYFLDQLRRGRGEKFLVKATLPAANGRTETLWITNVRVKANRVSGVLAETPRRIPRTKKGARVTLHRDQVVDWMIVRNGRTFGAFTGRPKL